MVALRKFAAAAYTNSGATFAEAAHSSADCLNPLLLIAGRRAARNRPNEQHPLGFGRETHFYAMLTRQAHCALRRRTARGQHAGAIHAPETRRARSTTRNNPPRQRGRHAHSHPQPRAARARRKGEAR
ncbi:cation efflux family protein [Paraburkholderia silvatlantica]|nr:cation efflux family protein [Paraburkholderia silvatlantica]